MKTLRSPWNLLGGLVFLAGLFAFWYGGRLPTTRVVHPPAPVVAPEAEAKEVTLALYFAKPDGTGFVLEKRKVQLDPGEDRLARALAELVRGPEIAGASPLLPKDAPPPAVYRMGRAVVLDLPAGYRDLGYGVRGESLLLYGLANTALANSDAEEVRFLLAGRPAMALIHLSLADPIRRAR